MDVDVVAVDALCLVPIFIVCCNTLELVPSNNTLSLRYGNRGMEVRLGHNCERGKQDEDDVDVDVVAVDALCLVPIFIVCCNTLELVPSNFNLSLRYGNGGIEVRLGQSLINNFERQGNDGSNRWSGSLS